MAEDNKTDNSKQKETEATKNAAVNAAKAYGGPLGAGVSLASKTKLGNALLNKGAEAFNKQNPMAGKLAGALNRGNSDLINNKQKDSKSNPAGAGSTASSGESTEGRASSGGLGSVLGGKGKGKAKGNASTDDLDDNRGNDDFAAFLGRILKKHWPKVAAVGAGATLFLIIIIAVYLVVASIAGGVIEFFTGIGDALVGFFDEDQQKLIEKYYDELEKVRKDFLDTYNVCIDTNLITATLTVDLDAAEYADNIDNPPKGDKVTGGDEGASSEVVETEKDYKKMTKEVGILASMQVKRKIYGHDQEILDTDCRSYEEGAKEELVTDENLARLVPDDFWDSFIKNFFLTDEKKREKYVSINADLVSRHDLNSFQKFFTKKINEEKNYEYYIYSPAYHEECDDNGQNCQLVCNKNALPSYEEIPFLSIGDLKTMEESVYYWNLVNSFIPNYYDEYLPEGGEERDKAIKKIAELIYLLYNDIGPSDECQTTQEYICRDDEGGSYYAGETSTNGTPIAAANQNDFFNKISDAAINGMSDSGIFASITMAQAALESSWGKSTLSTRYANYYGMTAGSCVSISPSAHKGTVLSPGDPDNSCTGNAYWNGTIVAMCNKEGKDCQWYRVYDSFENSTKDHSRLLSTGRYSDCNSYATPKEQIQCIKGHGYATDAGYVNKVMNMINKYGLTEYDIGEWDGTLAIEPANPVYNTNICVHPGSGESGQVSGDWRNWKQCNQPWGSQYIGSKTICQVGCAATSVAILLAKSGTYTTLGSSLNPGTFVQAHKANGGFYGNNIMWDVTDVAPNFRLVGRHFGGISVAQVASYVNSGMYVILNVKHGGHFVAVDYVSGGAIHIIDPGYNRTIIPGDYTLSEIAGYVVYRKVD